MLVLGKFLQAHDMPNIILTGIQCLRGRYRDR